MTITNLAWLTQAYMESHRKYHDLAHIAQMFHMADQAKLELTEEQILAIWFHDCVYDPFGHNNEKESARKAGELLSKEGAPPELIKKVQTIVMDTKTHVASIDESRAVLDLDISIFAADRQAYTTYMQLIRDEYRKVPYDTYRIERAKILTRYLQRAKKGELYYLLGDLNERTIENLQWEIDNLRGHASN